ncbi:hypothetical protein [Haploplasma axanthum]|uniref:Uncharacterized protein n=1 Tax=Haploplasma axanthum TaxID=29552 RepID=A0A449BB77_HAPAX|nr:hypothetical protein [Haploplasma axanthum]VEU79550.1 Uncharacterised protein [Haploplasma axanthum]VEU81342.1 Uncharacterised protein [Haploplasma axanthum]VEU81361.1 Uncharacterised protein [Haploplasma axanthum]VEU81378.1 Uncharacterised protein [Haploplasma axanthum]
MKSTKQAFITKLIDYTLDFFKVKTEDQEHIISFKGEHVIISLKTKETIHELAKIAFDFEEDDGLDFLASVINELALSDDAIKDANDVLTAFYQEDYQEDYNNLQEEIERDIQQEMIDNNVEPD